MSNGKKRVRSLEGLLAILLLTTACSEDAMEPTIEQAPRIELNSQLVHSDSHQEFITFSARVLDRKGRQLNGIPLEWDTDNPDVLEVLGDGKFRTLTNGTATVIVRISQAYPSIGPDGYFANIPTTEAVVEVKQTARSIALFTTDDSGAPGLRVSALGIWAIDDLRALAARPVDNAGQLVNGVELADLTWTSADERIVAVDAFGRVTPVSDGETTIRVSAGALVGEVVVRVRATQLIRTCARLRVDSGSPGSGAEACASVRLTFTRGS